MASPTVFISYAREDKQIADKIADALRNSGITVWLDIADLKVGQEWEKTIEHAVIQASLFLILLSHDSVDSNSYCSKELNIAKFHVWRIGWYGPFICPVRLNESVKPSLNIGHLHSFDLLSHDENNITRLVNEIKSVMPKYRIDFLRRYVHYGSVAGLTLSLATQSAFALLGIKVDVPLVNVRYLWNQALSDPLELGKIVPFLCVIHIYISYSIEYKILRSHLRISPTLATNRSRIFLEALIGGLGYWISTQFLLYALARIILSLTS